MIHNRSAPSGPIVPTLIYDDLARAIDWLCGAFGFVERLRVSGPDGTVGHAQLAVGSGGIMLGVRRTAQGSSGESVEFRPPMPDMVSMTLNVHVEDVDAHHARAKAFGARITSPPTDYPYGERQYSAMDLEGHRWSFSQSITDVAPEDWGAIVAK